MSSHSPKMKPVEASTLIIGLLALTGCGSCGRTSTTERGPAESVTRASTPIDEGLARIGVPDALAKKTSLELSGIAWSSALDRYLLVSDDTAGEDTPNKHAPWIFALRSDGVLDSDPVPIEGIDELDDPESICTGPDTPEHGTTFFVTTSHSANKKGRTKASRRKLLWLSPRANRTFRVLGQVDLTTARDRDGRGLLALAGLLESGALDIEGIAWHEGLLYVGLKSPLSDDSNATILAMRDPVSVMKAGSIPPGAMVVWSRARLCLPNGVCQGVADMTFTSDGSLFLVANAPKGMPTDGGGALWKLGASGAPPELVRRFDGFKPEGITPSPDGRSLVIVFDTDRAEPRWLRMPSLLGR